MLAEMPARVLREWALFYQAEPFGEERADLRAAMVQATMANIWARKKGKPAYKPRQFMPKFGGKRAQNNMTREQHEEYLKMKLWILNQQFGGEVRRAE